MLTPTAVYAQAPNPSNQADLAAFLEPRIQEAMARANIPGAVVVIVKDGQIVFSEGYGYTNLEAQIPTNPDTTGFRVASLTKLFTATAVLQLVDQGLVDLHTDINHYLPFTVPNTYPAPITLHHPAHPQQRPRRQPNGGCSPHAGCYHAIGRLSCPKPA